MENEGQKVHREGGRPVLVIELDLLKSQGRLA